MSGAPTAESDEAYGTPWSSTWTCAYSVTVSVDPLRFSHLYDLPRAIVWHAFVDPDLIGGWLGEAEVDPVEGGLYRLGWVASVDFPPAEGYIVEIVAPTLLIIATDVHGTIRVDLEDVPGGMRGSSTRVLLTVDVDVSAPFRARVVSNWSLALAQLEGLLRGVPVDWASDPSRSGPLVRSDAGADLA